MNQVQYLMPQHPWSTLEKIIRSLGEMKADITPEGVKNYDAELLSYDIMFLQQLGFVHTHPTSKISYPKLTDVGKRYFELQFIENQFKKAKSILREQLSRFPPAELVIQSLRGVPQASKSNVDSLLRSHQLVQGLSEASLGTFLTMLNYAGVISYSRRTSRVQVLLNPTVEAAPRNVFIAPETPYSNIIWLRRVLSECRKFIYWLDKHFYKIGLEHIWEVADGAKVQQIHILSLQLQDNLNQAAKNEYNRLRQELVRKGISLEWRVIESQKIKDTHDRWIIGENYARNVPNINAIHSGQRAELNLSNNYDEVLKAFLSYWDIATPV